MKKEKKKSFYISICILVAFLLWTAVVRFVDLEAIGPRGSTVGLATVNRYIHNFTGVNMTLYTITDWLGILPILFVIGFGILGLVQWIKRGNILKVDYDILTLGGFYIVVIAVYLFFEMFVVNYRPVLINGYLEASYPSSTTMLVMCVMPTGIMLFSNRIKNKALRNIIAITIIAFIAFMVIGRLLSGVHWITDIVGGALLSTGLVLLYRAIIDFKYIKR